MRMCRMNDTMEMPRNVQDCGNLELIKKFFLCLFEVTSCVIETDRAYRIMLLKE